MKHTAKLGEDLFDGATAFFNRPTIGGPDHIPPICSNNLLYPISFLFQLYFDNSFLPELWRQAYVSRVSSRV